MDFKISGQTRSYSLQCLRTDMIHASVRCLGRVQRCYIMHSNIRGSLKVTDSVKVAQDTLIQYLCWSARLKTRILKLFRFNVNDFESCQFLVWSNNLSCSQRR